MTFKIVRKICVLLELKKNTYLRPSIIIIFFADFAADAVDADIADDADFADFAADAADADFKKYGILADSFSL